MPIALVELPRLHANRKVRTWVGEFGGEEIGVVEKAPRQQWEARLLGRAGVRPIGYFATRLAAARAVYRARWDIGGALRRGEVLPSPPPSRARPVAVKRPPSASLFDLGGES
jgi:hypothetical protein